MRNKEDQKHLNYNNAKEKKICTHREKSVRFTCFTNTLSFKNNFVFSSFLILFFHFAVYTLIPSNLVFSLYNLFDETNEFLTSLKKISQNKYVGMCKPM